MINWERIKLRIGPEQPVFYIIFMVIHIVFYFFLRSAIYGCYRAYLRDRVIKKIKDSKNKFKRITGLYLLTINKGKGQSIFLKIALVLTNIQTIFIPLLLIICLLNILGVDYIREGAKIVHISCIIMLAACWLIIIHYILKVRFKKQAYYRKTIIRWNKNNLTV
jgi:amino acid transporter